MLTPDHSEMPVRAAALPSPEELIARANAMVPLLRENGLETERLRRLPETTILELEDAGIFSMLQPTNRGGLGTDVGTISRVMTTIASGCASTTWVLSIYSSVAQLAELLSEEALTEIYAGTHPRIAGVFGKAGAVLERTPGGFRVRGAGHWPFNSGCRHADWDLLRVTVDEGDGSSSPAFVAVPMTDLIMCDDWDVMGAMGTGSNSVMCRDLFIPEHRLARVPPDIRSVMRADLAAATSCALPLGMARHALNAFAELARTRGINHLGYARMGDAPVVQAAFAAATADVQLIECYQQWVLSPFTGGPPMSEQEAATVSIGSVRCFELTRAIVERLLALAPSTEIQLTRPIQRLLRDIHVFEHQHAATPFINYEMYGRRFFSS
jgi:alkylation response protein AidB-like acyl-CoA dehydrogenase